MITTYDALRTGWQDDKYGWYLKVDDVEIRLEPLLFNGQFYLAVYKNKQLIGTKVVMKPGYIKSEDSKNEP